MKGHHRLTFAAISLLAICTTAEAQPVYKSVDAQGQVTYSSTPPATAGEEMVEQVQIAPGPTEQQKRDAAQQASELESATRRAELERQEQRTQHSQATSDTEQELRKARIALEEAETQSVDDWQYLATGGRVLKQSYLDRVDAAKRRVQQAEKSARGAKSGRR